MFYIDGDGCLKEDKQRSNVKISHTFFTELVDQLVQYMLSGKDSYVRSDIPELQSKLDDQFNYNDDFNAELNELLTGVSSKGREYLYAYKNEEGKLCFSCADSLGIAEVRENENSDECSYIVRWYVSRYTEQNQPVRKIEVWDKTQTYFYIQIGNAEIEVDTNVPFNPRPHVVYTENGKTYGEGLGFIPFFRLDNNKNATSDITLVKNLIDDYDMMNCSLSNNLQDFTEGIYVIKGYEGSDLNQLQMNLKTKKIIGVDEGGDIDIKTISIPYEARKTKMELDEKNIYRCGMGFNSSQLGDGNVTNVVIKSRYTLLDLKANKLESKLKRFLRMIVKIFLDQINEEEGTAYTLEDIWFEFKRETISNDTDNATIALTNAQTEQTRINTLMNLQMALDEETFMSKVCEVLDIDYEDIKDRLPKEDEAPEEDLEGAMDQIEE